jgi:hypothetical protein
MTGIKENKYPGITYFGVLLIIGSLMWFYVYPFDYAYYQRIFMPLSEKMILLRYSLSMLFRIVGFICGIGILLRKDIFRRIALFVTVLNIFRVHPKQAIYSSIERNFSMLDFSKVSTVEIVSSSAHIALIIVYCIEIIFSVWFIYYFTRSGVKGQFK